MNTLKVQKYKGIPTLFLNGTPITETFYTFDPIPGFEKQVRNFASIGVHWYTFLAPLLHCWKGPGHYDWSFLDRVIDLILKTDPQAYLIPRTFISTPRWWDKLHPEELIGFLEKERKPYPEEPAPDNLLAPESFFYDSMKYFHSTQNPSLASSLWKKEMGETLRLFVRHTQKKYPGHFVGYQIAYGDCGEWGHYGTYFEGELLCSDFSTPMVTSFRQWLRRKYKSVDGLRKSWLDSKVDFTNALPPDQTERLMTHIGCFRNPRKSHKVLDYYDFVTFIRGQSLEHFCRIVKEETDGNCTTGAFGGAAMQTGSAAFIYPMYSQDPAILRSPYVDFWSTPAVYYNRTAGTGSFTSQGLPQSVQLHGKLWMAEVDSRTHRSEVESDVSPPPLNVWQSIQVLKRDFAFSLQRGEEFWWYDFGRGWYDDPQILKTLKTIQKIMKDSVKYDRRSVAEVGIFLDRESLRYQESAASEFIHRLLQRQNQDTFSRMGVPYDLHYLEDIEIVPPYRVYIFLNAFFINSRKRKAIHNVVCKNRRTAVWYYAPGFLGPDGSSLEGMETLTGIRFGQSSVAYHLLTTLRQKKHPLLEGMPRFIGATAIEDRAGVITPLFYVDDPQAETLGYLQALDRPGLALKEFQDWRSLYIASPIIPPRFYINLFRYAGVHVYLDTEDIVLVNRSYLAINASSDGIRHISLPREKRVLDAFNGRLISPSTKEITCKMRFGETRIFRLE